MSKSATGVAQIEQTHQASKFKILSVLQEDAIRLPKENTVETVSELEK